MTEDAHPPELVSTHEAARLLGVPEAEFSRLVRALALEPARPGSKKQQRLWQRTLIEALKAGPEGAELREAVSRKQQIEALLADLAVRYPQWQAALRPAADALFNFNRYAKWARCSRLRRRELYALKDSLIHLLYERGLCRECCIHTVAGEEEECEGCEGTGTDLAGVPCPGCAGKGVLADAAPREYLAFWFIVDGQWFGWHTPRKSVLWSYQLTERLPDAPDRRQWQPNAPEKPIHLAAEEFLHAEAVLRFVLKGAAAERDAQRQQERQKRHEENRREGLARQAALRKEQEEGKPPETT
jgi:hypothetical protein